MAALSKLQRRTKVDNSRFRVATSAENAASGIYVDITSPGVGYYTLTSYNDTPGSIEATTVEAVNLTTQQSARQALPTLAQRLSALQRERGAIGSHQSRLTTMIQVISAARENYISAESRISDVDVAAESGRLVRQEILQKSGVAVLAQANLAPKLALNLLNA